MTIVDGDDGVVVVLLALLYAVALIGRVVEDDNVTRCGDGGGFETCLVLSYLEGD